MNDSGMAEAPGWKGDLRQDTASLPVFVHVSKAAGHTVRALLHRNYPASICIDTIIRRSRSATGWAATFTSGDPEIACLVAEIQARQEALSFVATNLGPGIDYFLTRPVEYFAFVREPVARCISYWYFAYRERDSHPAWRQFESQGFDIPRILASGEVIQLANHQTRLLLGSSDIEIGEEHFEAAVKHIPEDFVLVGAVERFDHCLSYVGNRFGWRVQTNEPLHVGDYRDESLLPAGAEEAFRAGNHVDSLLHEWVMTSYLPDRLGTRG